MGKSFIRRLLNQSSREPVESLSIRIYNKNKDGELFSVQEGSTCENICQQIGQELGITPTMLHCFGLRKYSKSGNHDVWLSPMEQIRLQTESANIHFRMRFLPMDPESFQNKSLDDKSCVRYLFWQIHWDFLHDKIDYYKQKDNVEKTRGLVVLSVLIHLRLDTELRNMNGDQSTENLQSFLDSHPIKSFLPTSVADIFIIDRMYLESTMKERVQKHQEAWPPNNVQYNSTALMKSFIHSVLQKDRNIFCECYSVFSVLFDTKSVPGKPNELLRVYKDREKLEVIVDMNRRPAEIFISKGDTKRSFPIDNLASIEMCRDDICNLEEVHLTQTDRPPEFLYFEHKETAESFVTCVETFHRLCYNFHHSLCPGLLPRNVRDIHLVKAYGPVSTDYIKEKIDKQYSNSSNVYVLRKSLTEHDVYEVLRCVDGSPELRIASLGKFEGNKNPAVLKKLMHDRILEVEGLQPENCTRIHPKVEACDVLAEMFLKEDTKRIQEEDELDEMRRLDWENQPKVIMGSDLKVHKHIGKGYFTEVFQGCLKDGEPVIIKRLRQSEIVSRLENLHLANSADLLSKLQEAFEESFSTLMKLRNPKFFLGFMGIALTNPQAKLLMEEKYGNLSYFLENRSRYECPLTMHHLQQVTIQLADALTFMEEKNCFHGNLHCGNIIITKFFRHEMLIKITDPGMISFYNQLRLDTVCNRTRLPWIAPELYENLPGITVRTEVYTYGMTLWQMYNEGQSPLTLRILMGKSVNEICQFFSVDKFPLPCPPYLKVLDDDSRAIKTVKNDMYELISNCCSFNQQERPCPMEILKKLLGKIHENNQEYHDYNIIYESESSSYNIQSSAGSSHGADDTSGIIPNFQPVVVPINDVTKIRENTPDENTVSKEVADNSAVQNVTCPILPGCMLLEDAKPIVGVPPTSPSSPSVPKDSSREPPVSDVRFIIAKDRLIIDTATILGSGYYGNIYKGTLKPNHSAGLYSTVAVAVKALKAEQAEKFQEEFKKEASIMEKLNHPNIVKFYGIYSEGRYMVMELIDKGSLYQFVQSCRREKQPITEYRQLCISIDIASGMEYLASKSIIHCDLAARNVLLTSDYRAKVSDFGLSKVLCQDKDYYRRNDQKTIPILWCAPEWIGFYKFLPKSDVWSFGVVLWEIYSYGKLPVIGNDNNLNHFYQDLYDKKRLAKPKSCPDSVYALMKDCWEWTPERRPSFTDVRQSLKNLFDKLMKSSTQVSSMTGQSKGPGVSSNISATSSAKKSPETKVKTLLREDTSQTETKTLQPGSNSSDQTGTLYAQQICRDHSLNENERESSDETEPNVPQTDGTSETESRTPQSTNDITDLSSTQQNYAKLTCQDGNESQTDAQGQRSCDANLSPSTYQKANSKGGFVEPEEDKGESHFIPNITMAKLSFSTNANKSETVARESLKELSKGDNTFPKMTQKTRSRPSIETIEAGLTVDRSILLGKGCFGRVYRGLYDGKKVAVKTCDKEEYRARFEREYLLLHTLEHPNIMAIIGTHSLGNGLKEYVMEFMSKGTLLGLLKKSNIDIHQKIQFLVQIAEGMDYLFSSFIVHGDLKTDNVLVNDHNTAKISDFGLAKQLDGDEVDGNYHRSGGVIKPYIASPETLGGKFNRFSDIWSYGVLCVEVLQDGKQPNFHEGIDFREISNTGNSSQLFNKIQSGERYQIPSSCPQELNGAITGCWEYEPKKRISYKNIKKELRSYLQNSHES